MVFLFACSRVISIKKIIQRKKLSRCVLTATADADPGEDYIFDEVESTVFPKYGLINQMDDNYLLESLIQLDKRTLLQGSRKCG